MNFGRFIQYRARSRPQASAVRDNNGALSYAELDVLAGKVAATLARRGIGPGSVVLVVSGNSLELAVLYAGIMYAGAVFAPVNFRLTRDEISRLRTLVGAGLDVADAASLDLVPGAVDLASLIDEACASPDAIACRPVPGEHPNNILFTSGTTGLPKGATLTHANLQASAANCALLRGLDASCVCYVPLPLYHTAGLHGQLTSAWYCGGEGWILNNWNIDRVESHLKLDRMTSVFFLPEQWEELYARCPDLRLKHLSDPRTGGARVTDNQFAAVDALTGRTPNFGMGMTECSPHVNFMRGEHVRRKNGAVGYPSVFADVIIRDDDNQPVKPGEVGEMRVRGPIVMTSYWNAPEATRDAFDADGYFCTGDLVVQDEEGFIRIVDRKKDLIRSGGENVFCVEVEQVLSQHEGVKDVAVVGYPHEKWGEAVAAVIVPQNADAPPSLADLQRWVTARLASYKKPLRLELMAELPRNRTGKIQKNLLRDQLRR